MMFTFKLLRNVKGIDAKGHGLYLSQNCLREFNCRVATFRPRISKITKSFSNRTMKSMNSPFIIIRNERSLSFFKFTLAAT